MVMLVSGPAWSMVADRAGLRDRLLTLVTGLSILPLLAMAWLHSWAALAFLTALHAVFLGPIQPLSDSSALSALGAERQQYSRIRALGSLSYAVVVWGTGLLLQGRDLRWAFLGFALFMGSACLISTGIRSAQPSVSVSLGSGLRLLMRDAGWVTFMVALFVAMVMQTVTFGYSALYLDALGASESVVGFSGALGSFGQTLLMLFVIPAMLRRWGSDRLLLLALGTYALRLGVWSLVPQVWAVVASMVVMGLTFGASLVAAVDYAD
jgi:PPP family 3-phenylpropionic acid transporter